MRICSRVSGNTCILVVIVPAIKNSCNSHQQYIMQVHMYVSPNVKSNNGYSQS